MGELTVTDDPQQLAAMFTAAEAADFAAWDDHPLYGAFGRRLYGAINDERQRHKTLFFAVIDGDAPLLLAPATSDGEAITMFGLPLPLAVRRDLGQKRQKRAFALAFEHLRTLAADHGCATMRLLGGDSRDFPTVRDSACIDQKARPEAHIHAIIDASQDEPALHRQLRDSYRSLVNWGRRQLRQVYVNADNPDRAAFDLYPAFHAKIAGSALYGDACWQPYWDDIAAGRGELSLGYLEDGRLASATLVIDAGRASYYASGVYERELFDKPLGHFPVFDAVLRAGQRGIRDFDLGEIFPAGAASEKEVQIGFFKKGFTNTFQLRTVWVID